MDLYLSYITSPLPPFSFSYMVSSSKTLAVTSLRKRKGDRHEMSRGICWPPIVTLFNFHITKINRGAEVGVFDDEKGGVAVIGTGVERRCARYGFCVWKCRCCMRADLYRILVVEMHLLYSFLRCGSRMGAKGWRSDCIAAEMMRVEGAEPRYGS